jgi:cardiolipin synthase A/B
MISHSSRKLSCSFEILVHNGANALTQIAELALAIADAWELESVCTALEEGRFNLSSTAPARAAIAEGSPGIETYLRSLQEAWRAADPKLTGQAIALALRTSVVAATSVRVRAPSTQVVWTGPKVEGSFLRATREVVREILRGARTELLVVGYWIAARDDGEGIIEELIALLADAVTRGVAVSVIMDERLRSDGRDNARILKSAWPICTVLPKQLTWRLPPTDQHLKLHAKVLIADRTDALVTSANLTSYAMDRNMEMGVRIIGRPAADIAKHFDLLVAKGVIEPYGGTRDPR